jgi:protein TonB
VVKVLVSETGDVEKTEVLSGDPILADAAVQATKMFKFKPFYRNGKPVKVSTKLPFNFHSSGAATANDSGAQGNSESSSGIAGSPSRRTYVIEGVIAGQLIHKVAPFYPELAKKGRVEGTVVLHAVIGKDGKIKDIVPTSGPKLLIPAAVEAVRQWVYKPYILLGQPVEVETQVTVNFNLSHEQFSR